ncbi:MAG TPA: MXAN_5187 C-terminal domain-containing protein, partial [Kofleriaceae bacterium]|nr:MXAN_5187 C-terminal domain-containing protein [Kofleriaceae bacterium]
GRVPTPPRAVTPVPVEEDADLLGDADLDEPPTQLASVDPVSGPTRIEAPRIDPYFKQVFDQFVALKKSCNESIAGLTYDKFAEKLIRNRDELREKSGCRDVRFTVYVKDGKAALKATPVKDD